MCIMKCDVFVNVLICHAATLYIVLFCSIFDVLRNEARVMEGLRSLLIDTPYIHDILKLNVQPSDSDYAVDIRNPAVNVSYMLLFFVNLFSRRENRE